MVARKREQVSSLSSTTSLLAQPRPSDHTLTPITSPARLAKVRSVPGIPGKVSAEVGNTNKSLDKGRRISHHASMGVLGAIQPRGLPSLGDMPKPQRPRSGGANGHARPLSAGRRAPEPNAGIVGNRIAPLHTSMSLTDVSGRNSIPVLPIQAPRSMSRRFTSTPSLTADDDEDDHLSTFSRSARTSVTSITSDTSSVSDRRVKEDISCLRRRNRPAVKKRPFKPPPDMPRWNTSTRVALKAKKATTDDDSNEVNMRRASSHEGLQDGTSKLSFNSDDAPALDDSLDNDLADDDEDEPDEYTETKYPVTPYQLDIFTKVCPTQDDVDSSTSSIYSGPPLYVSQAYHLDRPVQSSDLVKSVKRVVNSYIVLRTRFYRNDRIVDADVEGLLDRVDWKDVPDDEHVDIVDVDSEPSLTVLNSETLTGFVRTWMQGRERLDKTFVALLVNDSKLSPRHGGNGAWLVFCTSLAVADEMSCCWVAKAVLGLYAQCDRMRTEGRGDSEVDALIGGYKPREYYDFVGFAYDMESKPNRHAMTYWKSQCIETVQEVVDQREKADIEAQLGKLTKEQEVLKGQMGGLKKRKGDLEAELTTLREQRKQMESGDDTGGSGMRTYQDPTTGEIIRIPHEAKLALYKTVLGEEAGSADGNILGLLAKHEVPIDAQRKIHASTLTIETFATLTESQLTEANLLTKDRRKILALAEYVRNRIKECLQEANKVKFAVERRIAKCARELEGVSDTLKSAQDNLEANDDMCIRLGNILRPPYVEIKVPPITLDQHAAKTSGDDEERDYGNTYGFVPLNIPPEIVQNLRLFHDGQRATARQRRLHSQRSFTDSSHSTTDESSSVDSEDPQHQFGAREHRRRISSAAAVCLAAYSVLLKHISGCDKYLLGVLQSFRRNGLLIGPVSDIFPVKVDLTRKGITFNSLLGTLSRTMKELRRYGAACPLSTIQSQLGIAKSLPVQFEYIPYRDAEHWIEKGLEVSDLLLLPTSVNAQQNTAEATTLKMERRWFSQETNPFDVKLVLVETSTSLIGGIRYRQNKFDVEQVGKWSKKFEAILEGIDVGPRQIQISSIISRFYQSLWQGQPSGSGASTSSQGDSTGQRISSHHLTGGSVDPIPEE
ncbi:hypothetical protein SpCBS45565_g07308 [Spizellomyces sp. 'palustris']|nr:hypothetical protein SpCBS45565_g07308 [Spizellomyces sp. 'palustris']